MAKKRQKRKGTPATPNTPMDGKTFLDLLAQQLVGELAANAAIKQFTTNSAVIGAYAEASVRRFVDHVIFPLRTCTGAVIDEVLCGSPHTVPQIDTIIWAPSPAPAVFSTGDFGLVPRSSAFGLLEIKRSAYAEAGKQMRTLLDRAHSLVAPIAQSRFHASVLDAKTDTGRFWYPAMGVICVQESTKLSSAVRSLVDEHRAVVLMKPDRNGNYRADPTSVHRLVNFLIQRRFLAKAMEGHDFVNLNLLRDASKA